MTFGVVHGLTTIWFLAQPFGLSQPQNMFHDTQVQPVVDVADVHEVGPVMTADSTESQLLADAIEQLKTELAIQSPSDSLDQAISAANLTPEISSDSNRQEFRLALEDLIDARMAVRIEHEITEAPETDVEVDALLESPQLDVIPLAPSQANHSLAHQLRTTAAALDQQAHRLETTEDHLQADRLRNLAEQLRIEARSLASQR